MFAHHDKPSKIGRYGPAAVSLTKTHDVIKKLSPKCTAAVNRDAAAAALAAATDRRDAD